MQGYHTLDYNTLRIHKSEVVLKVLLFFNLVSSTGVTIVGNVFLRAIREGRGVIFDGLGATVIILFLLIAIIVTTIIGVYAVVMRHTSSLLVAFLLHTVIAASVIAVTSAFFVYLELSCPLVELGGTHMTEMLLAFCGEETPSVAAMEPWVRSTAEKIDLIVLVLCAYFAALTILISYKLLHLRFAVLRAAHYQRRNWRHALRFFKAAASRQGQPQVEDPHRHASASKELREKWEQREIDLPPSLRRPLYALMPDVGIKYRQRALLLSFPLVQSIPTY